MQGNDLEAVRVFVHVVQARGFSAAARQLGLPKSTVSRRIAQLEAQLGARLLHRTTRTLHLTDAGQLYFARAERVMAELEAAERDVLTMQAAPRGRLRISAPTDLRYLARLVTEYQRAHPEVEVFVNLTQRKVDLVGEGFDLALRAGHLDDSTLIARRLADLRTGLFASEGYLAQHPAPTHPDQLADHQLILFAQHGTRGTWSLFNAEGLATEVPVQASLAGDDFGFVHDAVASGAGIALMPRFLARASVEQGSLRHVLPDYESKRAALYAVYPSPQHLTPKVRAFIDHARRALETGIDRPA